jgi:hypothetical protein
MGDLVPWHYNTVVPSATSPNVAANIRLKCITHKCTEIFYLAFVMNITCLLLLCTVIKRLQIT